MDDARGSSHAVVGMRLFALVTYISLLPICHAVAVCTWGMPCHQDVLLVRALVPVPAWSHSELLLPV